MPKVPTPAKHTISTEPIDPFALIRTKHGHTNRAVYLDPQATSKVVTPAKCADSTEPVNPFTLMGMPPIQPSTRRRLIGAGLLGKGDVGQPMDVDEDQEGGIDDDNLSWLNDAKESKGQLGHIPKAQWECIKQVAKRVVEEIKQDAVEAGCGTNITIHKINKCLKVKITTHLALWNIYTSYCAHIAKTNQEAHLAKRTKKGKNKADGQSSSDNKEEEENATSIFSTSAGTPDNGFTAQVAALGDDSLLRQVHNARATLESVIMKWDYKLLRNMIKVVLTAHLHEFLKCFLVHSLWLISFIGLTGASCESKAYLTWDKIVSNMATAGVAIEERPVGE
ncbi:hypothetical protein EST38_g9292 [Candolleomyces aberdarensis]|uniref:Uncharacterized protein n=1 Tax=Candolleomyces aberdarensis TaxID=2316362 RepID=A0A4Q2DC17_9AGAR|nr:hypothetical protein EST38_g9292 [Candolleomyces aberdarensis]